LAGDGRRRSKSWILWHENSTRAGRVPAFPPPAYVGRFLISKTLVRGFRVCVRTRKEAADFSIPSLVGAPCFSRGELDFSPAETRFISQEWALALGFQGQRISCATYGFGSPHAAFLEESRTRGRVQCPYRKSGSPVFFGPRTPHGTPGQAWRTWGTRPVPSAFV
jgi:hypothetical protein